jgi:hypothetical protein
LLTGMGGSLTQHAQKSLGRGIIRGGSTRTAMLAQLAGREGLPTTHMKEPRSSTGNHCCCTIWALRATKGRALACNSGHNTNRRVRMCRVALTIVVMPVT